jgi:hypothetical protein
MSRLYAIVKPGFWTGKTGRAITRLGKDVRILADYLITSPHANLIGLYSLSIPIVAHETGLTLDEVSAALATLGELDFAHYDYEAECVWVTNMARFQMAWKGDGLSEGDKRVKASIREYEEVTENTFLGAFFDFYATALHLPNRRCGVQDAPSACQDAPSRRVTSAPLSDAPSKSAIETLPDQEQELELELELEHVSDLEHAHEQGMEPEEGEDEQQLASERTKTPRLVKEVVRAATRPRNGSSKSALVSTEAMVSRLRNIAGLDVGRIPKENGDPAAATDRPSALAADVSLGKRSVS